MRLDAAASGQPRSFPCAHAAGFFFRQDFFDHAFSFWCHFFFYAFFKFGFNFFDSARFRFFFTFGFGFGAFAFFAFFFFRRFAFFGLRFDFSRDFFGDGDGFRFATPARDEQGDEEAEDHQRP